MKEKEILENIKMLAESQGLYGRIYRALMEVKEENLEDYKKVMESFERQNFKDVLDLVMFIEE